MGLHSTLFALTRAFVRRALAFRCAAELGALFALTTQAAAIPAQIDATATRQIIRGFGGATVFLPTTPLTDGDLDTLFGNGPGQIGLTLLRIRVAPDARGGRSNCPTPEGRAPGAPV